jgi:23S rRNA (adenine2503-C2)-methyltransferase
MNKLISFISSTPSELTEIMTDAGFSAYRGSQIFHWIHKRGVLNVDLMKNLPEDLRRFIKDSGEISAAVAREVHTSYDGTRKIAVSLNDGSQVETVLIPEGNRLTQCISSQVGCAAGCLFCRSGKFGLKRNMTAAEIISQIFIAKPYYKKDEVLRNVVFMGVGEPLHNLKNVLKSLKLLSFADGLNLSSRRVTLSTVGILNGIKRLAEETNGNTALAISLHAATDDVRAQLVPNVNVSIFDIVDALKKYPLPRRRRFTIEYVLVKGINDSDSDARALAKLLSSIRVKINLLPLNPHDMTDLQPPDRERIAAFQNILISKGLSVFMRKRRGDDINAACGQLLAMDKNETV